MKYIITFLIGTVAGFLLSTFNHLSQKNSEDITKFQAPIKTSDKQLKTTKTLAKKTELDTQLVDNKTINTIATITQSNTVTTDILTKKINKLEAENMELNEQYQNLRSDWVAVTNQKEKLDESEITDQQMLTLKEDKFAKFRLQFLGKHRDDVFNFHQQEDDLNWGYKMSILISDFIQLHYNSNLIAVEGLTCKVDSCELLVIELEDNGWDTIMRDMRTQPWWNFTSTQSSSSGGKKQNLFYLYLSS